MDYQTDTPICGIANGMNGIRVRTKKKLRNGIAHTQFFIHISDFVARSQMENIIINSESQSFIYCREKVFRP